MLHLLRLTCSRRLSSQLSIPYASKFSRANFRSSSIPFAMAQEFKLKGLSSLDLKDGQKEEVEVEGVEGGKVLISKIGGKVYATSANCTHYGAPLKNGILSPDGRLTCPWHGACFHVATGDIEDAPALDPLTTYQIVEKEGAVYVKSDEATIKANRTKLNLKCQIKSQENVVVVGGGSGAIGVIEGLRGGGFTGKITVITKEGYRPIDRTKLSKALLAEVSKVAWRPEEFYKDASIDIVADEATSIDFSGKTIATKSGKTYDYTKLVLATGGTPNWLPLPGLKGDLGNVFILREVPDAKAIVDAVGDNGKKIVVVGSSFIGLEIANCLVGKKNDVTVIGMERVPMERVMGEKVGRVFQKLLEKSGIKFKMEASVEKATPSKSDSSKVGAVHLKDGTTLEADEVILGVGVKPATQWLKESKGLTFEKDGGIRTDETFAVNGLKDVFAIGDIATYPYHGPGGKGGPVRIEHWNVAQNAGRAVAKHINGKPQPKAFIPVFWSALGSQLRYCGNTVNGYDDVVIIGDTEKPAFIAYYTSGETVVACASMGKDPLVMKSMELMRSGKMPTKSELEKGADVLSL